MLIEILIALYVIPVIINGWLFYLLLHHVWKIEGHLYITDLFEPLMSIFLPIINLCIMFGILFSHKLQNEIGFQNIKIFVKQK